MILQKTLLSVPSTLARPDKVVFGITWQKAKDETHKSKAESAWPLRSHLLRNESAAIPFIGETTAKGSNDYKWNKFLVWEVLWRLYDQ